MLLHVGYDYKVETFVDTHKLRKQRLLCKSKCVHCQSKYFNYGTCIDFNNYAFLCSSCNNELNQKDEELQDVIQKKDTSVMGKIDRNNEDNYITI